MSHAKQFKNDDGLDEKTGEPKVKQNGTKQLEPTPTIPPNPPANPPVVKAKSVNHLKSFEEIKEFHKGNSVVDHTISVIERYLNLPANTEPQVEVATKYDFCVELRNVINTVDYNHFKQNFDIINRMFMIAGDGKFSEVALLKFDYHWTFGNESKLAFQIISEVIHTLADISTRDVNKGTIHVPSMFKYLTDTGISNITRYYAI